jgi:hypothetical protein
MIDPDDYFPRIFDPNRPARKPMARKAKSKAALKRPSPNDCAKPRRRAGGAQ